MPTGSIERADAGQASRPAGKFVLWMGRLWQRLVSPADVLREEEMPDWLVRDLGWRDGPADAPRAKVEGWGRPAATRWRRAG